MALLQQLPLPGCTSFAPVSAFTAPVPERVTVPTSQPPKSLRLSICRAASEIFEDESNGILCYYDENGDVTCEGWDEGPHFQPDQQQPSLRRRRRFAPRAMQVRCRGEAVSFKHIKERMGASLREVANESFECSEL